MEFTGMKANTTSFKNSPLELSSAISVLAVDNAQTETISVNYNGQCFHIPVPARFVQTSPMLRTCTLKFSKLSNRTDRSCMEASMTRTYSPGSLGYSFPRSSDWQLNRSRSLDKTKFQVIKPYRRLRSAFLGDDSQKSPNFRSGAHRG